MKNTFIIDRHEKFEIVKGTVISVHRDDNDIEDVEVGDFFSIKNEEFEIIEIEHTRGFSDKYISKNIMFLVKLQNKK